MALESNNTTCAIKVNVTREYNYGWIKQEGQKESKREMANKMQDKDECT